jgi:hypothetical protein
VHWLHFSRSYLKTGIRAWSGAASHIIFITSDYDGYLWRQRKNTFLNPEAISKKAYGGCRHFTG